MHPIDLREELARRFPRWMQRFFTWLTGLTHRGEAPRPPWSPQQHLWAYFGVAGMAIGLTGWSAQTLADLAHRVIA